MVRTDQDWRKCEICHAPYQVEFRSRPFCQWKRPELDQQSRVRLGMVAIFLPFFLGIFIYSLITQINLLIDIAKGKADPFFDASLVGPAVARSHATAFALSELTWVALMLVWLAFLLCVLSEGLQVARLWRKQNTILHVLPEARVRPAAPTHGSWVEPPV